MIECVQRRMTKMVEGCWGKEYEVTSVEDNEECNN